MHQQKSPLQAGFFTAVRCAARRTYSQFLKLRQLSVDVASQDISQSKAPSSPRPFFYARYSVCNEFTQVTSLCVGANSICELSTKTDAMNKLFIRSISILAIALAGSAYAQGGYQPNGYGGVYGTGSNNGAGYQSNGYGGVNGTGRNTGGGYQSNGHGGVNGTGSNVGGGWQSNGSGGINGTGSNVGSGWQPNGSGGYYGTGKNVGRNCQPTSNGGMNCR